MHYYVRLLRVLLYENGQTTCDFTACGIILYLCMHSPTNAIFMNSHITRASSQEIPVWSECVLTPCSGSSARVNSGITDLSVSMKKIAAAATAAVHSSRRCIGRRILTLSCQPYRYHETSSHPLLYQGNEATCLVREMAAYVM